MRLHLHVDILQQLQIFTIFLAIPVSFTMDILNRPTNDSLLVIPSDPLALRLHCPAPSCNQHISWNQVELTPSKKTYACPHCHFVFCLICKELPSTYETHGSTSECLLNSTTTGALSALLLFHETLLELKGLSETQEQLASLKRGDILDPGFMNEVDDAIRRTEAAMKDTSRIAGDLYAMMCAEDLKTGMKD